MALKKMMSVLQIKGSSKLTYHIPMLSVNIEPFSTIMMRHLILVNMVSKQFEENLPYLSSGLIPANQPGLILIIKVTS